jgi:hypothetical protein
MLLPDEATIHALRRDLALQVSRTVRKLGATQAVAARQLGSGRVCLRLRSTSNTQKRQIPIV